MTNLENLLNIKYNDILGCKAVSGRNLHEVLGIKKVFTEWIKTQLDNTIATENQDYFTVWSNPFKGIVKFNGNANSMTRQGYSVDYILSLDTAKEICMCVGMAPNTNNETKKLSKEIRKYFLECEKQLKVVAVQSPQAFVDSLSLTKDGIEKYLPNFLTYKNVDEVIPALIERIVAELDKGLIKIDVLNAVIVTAKKIRDAYPIKSASCERALFTKYIDEAEAKYRQIQNGTLLGTTRAKEELIQN